MRRQAFQGRITPPSARLRHRFYYTNEINTRTRTRWRHRSQCRQASLVAIAPAASLLNERGRIKVEWIWYVSGARLCGASLTSSLAIVAIATMSIKMETSGASSKRPFVTRRQSHPAAKTDKRWRCDSVRLNRSLLNFFEAGVDKRVGGEYCAGLVTMARSFREFSPTG